MMLGCKGLELTLSRLTSRSNRYIHRSIDIGDAAFRTRRKKPPFPSKLGETLEERQHRIYGQVGNNPNNSASQQSNNTILSKQYEQLLESHSQELFVARDNAGNEITMDQYMKELATLSPWVGSPNAAIRKCLDIAKASSTDIHYELGCGDGRVNFYAIDAPYSVKKSVGIDVDDNLIQSAWNRLARRHPKPKNVEFITADLMNIQDEKTQRLWEQMRDECTILTMFFVEEGLAKLRPLFERYLKGSKVKIITIGYPMKGWKISWEEVVLDLRIHLYLMNNDTIQDDILVSDTLSEYSTGTIDVADMEMEVEPSAQVQAQDQFVSNDQKGPPLQRLEYDPNEDVDNHWDDFDQDLSTEQAGEDRGRGENLT